MDIVINFIVDVFLFIPNLFSWLPSDISGILLIGVSIAVAYQVLGR